MISALLLAVIVLSGTGGNLAIKQAMNAVGQLERFAVGDVARMLGRALRTGWLWLGVALLALSFFSFLGLLSREDLSFAVPATAMSYVVGTLGARFLLGEQVNAWRWGGVLLVCAGVLLASLG